uniref:Ovule protein n=1 Tax=Heterorhabditis bacteriophora TaxID=37862 RepID=A0A1I7X3Q0_HETBA
MKPEASTARPKTSVWRTPKANRKSIHHAGKNEEVSDFKSRSQESQDRFCPCTHAMDSGNSFFNVYVPFQYRLHFIQVIFSVKKKFNLGSPDGSTSYWRDLRKERRFFLHETLKEEA